MSNHPDRTPLHFELTVKCRTEGQLTKAATWLAQHNWTYTFEAAHDGDGDYYAVTLHDIPWADNLVYFARFLRKLDKPV